MRSASTDLLSNSVFFRIGRLILKNIQIHCICWARELWYIHSHCSECSATSGNSGSIRVSTQRIQLLFVYTKKHCVSSIQTIFHSNNSTIQQNGVQIRTKQIFWAARQYSGLTPKCHPNRFPMKLTVTTYAWRRLMTSTHYLMANFSGLMNEFRNGMNIEFDRIEYFNHWNESRRKKK